MWQRLLLLSTLALTIPLHANDQNQDTNDICGKPTESMLDALDDCAKRFEGAADEFKKYLDSNIFKNEQNVSTSN